MSKTPLVTSGSEWSFDKVEEVTEIIEDLAHNKYGLDIYPNQIEVISAEQMLDAYSANGLPVFYPHWSFGEVFVGQQEAYKRGHMGLAYEIVINSNPCIAYLMEENSMLMQTLVIAHASVGHNSVFKNNYLFKMWTSADTILDYLLYARKYIKDCEEEYGYAEVERILNTAHAIQHHGVDKYKKPLLPTAAQEEKRKEDREAHIQTMVNDLWRTVPKKSTGEDGAVEDKFPKEPQENLLRFIEENAPRLESWEREILRIVRTISQYFYPQMQTKVVNEGVACFWHYRIMNDLYEMGVVSADAMMEFITAHTGVINQPKYDKAYYNGINPYALGFNMMQEIERVATEPTEEDRRWFQGQSWVGSGDWLSEIKNATANFKDESFVRQYLTPNLLREFKIFDVYDDEDDPALEVVAIHDDEGCRHLRKFLAEANDIGNLIPDIQAVDVDRWGNRSLTLRHNMVNDRPMDEKEALLTLEKIGDLWGYDVSLKSHNPNGEFFQSFHYKAEDGSMSVKVAK